MSDMQTNQTPEAVALIVRDVCELEPADYTDPNAVCVYRDDLEAILVERLRDMAASGAKDAEALNWLEARRLEGIVKGYKWDSWSYDTDRPVRDQLAAAIAATKKEQK